MKANFFPIFLTGMILLSSTAGGADEMNKIIHRMDSAEKKFKEERSQSAVAFMSLETMFPDPSVRALAKAAGDGRIKEVERLVREGVNVNARGTQGATPLFWALHDIDGFAKLLELGADPNVVYLDGNSVIHAAVLLRDRRILKAALDHGGNPNLVSGGSIHETPIFTAMAEGIEVVDVLLKHGANINARGSSESTPVLDAARVRDFEMVYCLLERGADYKLKDQNGYDLAMEVATSVGKLRPDTKWAKWQAKVIDWLHAKGVEIPPNPLVRH